MWLRERTRLNLGGRRQVSITGQIRAWKRNQPGEMASHLLLRLGIAARQLAQSVAEIQTIEIAWNESRIDEPPTNPLPVFIHTFPITRTKPGFALHPTTILGFQAVLATGLAMLAAYLLDFDQAQPGLLDGLCRHCRIDRRIAAPDDLEGHWRYRRELIGVAWQLSCQITSR